MHNKSFIVRSWMMLLAATLSWCGVVVFVFILLQMQLERSEYAADAATANLQEGQAAQIHALARETVEDRATLEHIANVDVLTAINMIESVNASGTPAHVVNAQRTKVSSKDGTEKINVADLSIHAEGPFSAVMRIVQMLETLPLATVIQQIDLSRSSVDSTAKNTPSLWQLNVRLRFYTTATLST